MGNRRLERELRDRTHLEHINSLSFDGKHLTRWAEVNYHVLGAVSDQTDPLTMTTTFRQANVNFAPNVSPTHIDPDNVQARKMLAAARLGLQQPQGALEVLRPAIDGADASVLAMLATDARSGAVVANTTTGEAAVCCCQRRPTVPRADR